MKDIIRFMFSGLFVFWLILCLLEIFMPGFVIYYLNLNWFLILIIVFGFIDLAIALSDKK